MEQAETDLKTIRKEVRKWANPATGNFDDFLDVAIEAYVSAMASLPAEEMARIIRIKQLVWQECRDFARGMKREIEAHAQYCALPEAARRRADATEEKYAIDERGTTSTPRFKNPTVEGAMKRVTKWCDEPYTVEEIIGIMSKNSSDHLGSKVGVA